MTFKPFMPKKNVHELARQLLDVLPNAERLIVRLALLALLVLTLARFFFYEVTSIFR